MPGDDGPDIVLLLVDQLRRDALGFYGDGNVRTPAIDRIAREGLVFDAMNATFPACVPFRFSLMTGEYAHSRMVPALGYRLSPAERTLGEAVQAAGLDTAWIGKWHLHSLYGTVGGQTLRQANRSPIPPGHRRGFDHWQGFELRNDFYDTCIFTGASREPEHLRGYQTDALFDLARDWLAQPRARPGFLTLSIEAPHPPFTAPEAALKAVRARGDYIARPNVDIDSIESFPPEWDEMLSGDRTMTDTRGEERARIFTANMQAYYAMIEVIDANLARLIAEAEARSPERETILLFLSDHGELGDSHGMLGKAEPWEESVGIPFVAWSTDRALVPPGRRCDTPSGTEDLFPTIAGLAGRSEQDAPGCDLSGLIRGTGPSPDREGVLIEFVAEVRPGRPYHNETWRGIRTRSEKYVVVGNSDGVRPWLCFDLVADPYEMRNLVDEPGERVRVARLHAQLMTLLAEAEDDYPITPLA